jgi:tape measure domain-containing protein
MANEVSVQLTVEEKQALSAIAKVTKSIEKMGNTTQKSVKKSDATFSSFKGNLAAFAASAVFQKFTQGILSTVEASKKMESISTQFRVILGSAEAAQKQVEDLQRFAAETPFQIDGIAESAKQLISFGVAQKNVVPTLKQLGDIAAVTGAQISDLTIPYGRLISTQKLTLVELDKFADRGVNLYKKLADQTGVSIKDIRDNISKGKIPFEEFTKAISDLTSEGGTFFNGMKIQSETLGGVLSTLDDNFINLQAAIGDVFKPAIIAGAKGLTTIIQQLTDLLKDPTASEQLDENTEAFNRVSEKARVLKEEIAEIKKDGGFLAEFKVNARTKELAIYTQEMQRLSGEMERQRLAQKAADSQGAGADPKDDPRVKKEEGVLAEINTIRANQALLEEENRLKMKEIQGVITEQELQQLRDIEVRKIEIQRDAEIEKANLIQDAGKRAAEIRKINAKAELAIGRTVAKQSTQLAKEQQQQELRDKQAFFGAAISLSSSNNKTLAAIGKAAALTQLAIKTPEAVASSFAFGSRTGGPVLGFVLGAIASAAMAAQAAKIAGISGFAQGGIVGGNIGASMGPDNTIIGARKGEMVLTANDQKALFQDIRARQGASGSVNELAGAINQLAEQEIVIAIDNREIARANRRALQEGFA